jgi:hypothetical protein
MAFYSDACSTATASFSVLSQTIKTVQGILFARKKSNGFIRSHGLIRQLQGHEKDQMPVVDGHPSLFGTNIAAKS